MKAYGDEISGNCYKVKLTLSLLGQDHIWVPINILNKDTHQASFLLKNPNAKVPVLELDDGRYLSESNAIINYLARDTDLLPSDPYQLALVQQWQFFEQYSHEPYIAVARFIAKYLGMPENKKAEFDSKKEGGYKALRVMEQQLEKSPFLVGENMSTADISLFAYTHVAHEGGFELVDFPAISAWIERVTQVPNFYPMPTSDTSN